MTFDPAWEAEHKRRQWGMIANQHLARFVVRTFSNADQAPKFLDIGAGAGAQTRFISEYGPVVALDGSASALDRITDSHWANDIFGQVYVHQSDIATCTFPEASFDCIVEVASLQCLPLAEATAVVQNARRWLRPNGWFFSYTDAGSHKSLHTVGTVYDRTNAQVRKMFDGYKVALGVETVDRPDKSSTRYWIIEAQVRS